MKIEKLIIKGVEELTPNKEIEIFDHFIIQNGKIVTYAIESKIITENTVNIENDKEKQKLEEAKRRKEEAFEEFKEKHQIRCGSHYLHQEQGMIPLPKSQEKFFETNTSKYLKKLFANFFEKSQLLEDKFKKSKRSYLLYSDPGMGKSALIRNFTEFALRTDGTAVVSVDGDINFNVLTHIFLKPYAEDVKRIILVIEDFGKKDSVQNATVFNPSCLNFLDGVAGLFRVPTMILCTTNFAKQLGPQLTNRPGRFNKLIKVLPPTDEEVFELVEGIAQIKMTESQKDAFRGKGMTPDHVIEAIIRHELEEISLQQSVNEVLSEREGMTQWV